MVDFNAQIKGNGEPVGRNETYVWPDDVLIEFNELYNTAPRQTGNPVTPIDVVGGRRWIIRGNFIHDHAKGGGNGISYAAFLKGNSREGLFERNLVVCELLHSGRTRLGLSFGGGGSGPPRICEDGTCTPEHQDGVMRNNIIVDCPADVGVYVNAGRNVRLLYNTLINTTGIDLRFESTAALTRGNLLDGRIRERDGATHDRQENVEQADLSAFFVDPSGLDLNLLPGAELGAIPRDDLVLDDYCARARGERTHVGALDYAQPPCGLRPPPRGEEPSPPDGGVEVDAGAAEDSGFDLGLPDGGLSADALLGESDAESVTDSESETDFEAADDGRTADADLGLGDAQSADGGAPSAGSGGCAQNRNPPGGAIWILALLFGWRRPE